jgi:hypothetical protein
METAQGRAMFQELLWVHDMLRRDLETVRGLAADALNGRPTEEIQSEVSELKAGRPLWQLKLNCIHYCRFVEGHHGLEDAALFPALVRTDPGITPVVERLEREHRDVAETLVRVEEAVEELPDDGGEEERRRLADALQLLGDRLLVHLDFEEQSIGPTLRRLERLGS